MSVMGHNSIPPSRTSSRGPEVCRPVGTSPREWAYSKNSWMTRPKEIKAGGVVMNPNNLLTLTMALNHAHSTEASNMAIVPITNNVLMDIDIEDPVAKAMAAAQDQLHVAMEAQAQEW